MVPGCTGEPWNAPAWYFSSANPATNLPSRVDPIFTRTVAPEVGPEALNTSSRDITIFTARLALRDRAMARGSRYTTVLPPTPPPNSGAGPPRAAPPPPPPANLGGGHPHLADVEPEQARAVGAHDEVPLRRRPQLDRAVLGRAGQRGVRRRGAP